MEEKFTNSTYMEFVWRHNAEFLKRTDFGGDFEVHFTDSTYMEFVIWAKKIPSELSKGAKFQFKVKNPVYGIFFGFKTATKEFDSVPFELKRNSSATGRFPNYRGLPQSKRHAELSKVQFARSKLRRKV